MTGSRMKLFVQKHALIFSMIVSFWALLSLPSAFKLGTGSLVISNSSMSVVLFLLFCYVTYMATQMMTRRSLIFSFFLGLLFSACLIYGTQIYLTDFIQIKSVSTLFHIVGLSLFFTVLFIILFKRLPNIERWIIDNDIKSNGFLNFFYASSRYFFCIWAVIFIFWIPTFLTAFPGIYGYDSIFQMAQFTNGFHLSSFHPIIHSLYLYGSLTIGKDVFGSYTIGMAIYSFTQMLMLSASYAYVCYFLARYKIPVIFQILTILYFSLVPIHSMFAVSSTKDVLFAAFLFLLVLFTLDMIIDPEKFFAAPIYQIRFVITAFLMLILRNNGIELFILCIPFFVLVFRKHWIKMLLLCVITLALFEIYTGPIYELLDVQPGDMREALSTPIQQLSRAMRDDPQKITEEEKKTVYEIIPKEAITRYDSRISDPVKFSFRTAILKENPMKYFKTWLAIGIKCPTTYINAFLSNNFGYWYPDMIYPDPSINHPYIEYNMMRSKGNFLFIDRHSLIPGFEKFYKYFSYQTPFQKIPVISMLFNEGFSFWLLILAGAICCYRKRYALFLPFMLYVGLWTTLLFSPVVFLRYAYPMMIAEPLMIAVILFGEKFRRC